MDLEPEPADDTAVGVSLYSHTLSLYTTYVEYIVHVYEYEYNIIIDFVLLFFRISRWL